MSSIVKMEPELCDLCTDTFLFLTAFKRRAGNASMDPTWVRQRLLAILEEQGSRAMASPPLHADYEKAKYLLAITADDVILGTEWEGADSWQSLEMELYQTKVGGVRFFDLLAEVSHNTTEMLHIFYLCLGVGFQGRYLTGAKDELEEIRQKIWLPISRVVPDRAERICPDAYAHTQEGELTKMPGLPALRIAVVLLGLMLLFGIGAWLARKEGIKNINDQANRILDPNVSPNGGGE